MHISLNMYKFNSSPSLICEALKKGLADASYVENECIHVPIITDRDVPNLNEKV